MKRILALLLAVLMLVPMMAACKKNGSKITLFKNGECKITYDANTVSGDDIKHLTRAIENATGITVEVVSSVTEDCQIVIGKVDHPAVTAAIQDIRQQDYVVGVYDGVLVIGAHTRDMITPAVRYFTRDLLALVEDGELKLTSEDNYHYVGKYTVGPITVGGMALTHHSIVIPTQYTQQELYYAYELYAQLSMLCGYELPLVTADAVTTEAQIRIGPSICEKATVPATHGYTITANGNHLEIAASTSLGYEGVRAAIFGTVLALDAKVENHLTNDSVWSEDYAGKAGTSMTANGDVRIMLSNMYGGHQEQHVMAPRTEMLTELYLIYRPDVLGLQEYSASANRTGFLKKLTDGGYVKVEQPSGAATNGGHDATQLLYNPDTVELLDSGYLRFNSLTYSEYPEMLGSLSASNVKEKCRDGSKGFDWAIFRHKGTNKVFLAASVHLWFRSDDTRDSTARKIQIQAMKDTLTAAAASFAAEKGLSADTLPIFVGGDYNCNLSSGSPLHQMTRTTQTGDGDDSTFVNANSVATDKLTITTHHGYGTYTTGLSVPGLLKNTPSIGVYHSPVFSKSEYTFAIDHIYTNVAAQSMVRVNRMSILKDYNAYLSSDHNPVYVDVSLLAGCPVYTGSV